MRILVVEDQQSSARFAVDELKRYLACDVTVALTPHRGIAELRAGGYDVVVIDMLFRAETANFEQRRRAKKVSLDDVELHLSGLAVLDEARRASPPPRPVLWSSGEPNRHLHMLFAFEELACAVFCAKDGSDDLAQAVAAAYRGEQYISPTLSFYVPNVHGKPLRETILSQSSKLAVWRAIALGTHQHTVLARLTGVSSRTIRTGMGEMRRRLLELDPGLSDEESPSTEVLRFASQNWEFFLDQTVRRHFP